jgi:hypothetical protein
MASNAECIKDASCRERADRILNLTDDVAVRTGLLLGENDAEEPVSEVTGCIPILESLLDRAICKLERAQVFLTRIEERL